MRMDKVSYVSHLIRVNVGAKRRRKKLRQIICECDGYIDEKRATGFTEPEENS